MSWIITRFGHPIDLTGPHVDEIDLRDIIHVLSHLNRFNHHTGEFYSVAEHSLILAMNAPAEFRLQCLLHDAAEAYLSDIPGPLKKGLADVVAIEKHILSFIYEVFGVETTLESVETVNMLDKRIVVNEQRKFFPVTPNGWVWSHDKEPRLRPLPFFPYRGLRPVDAAAEYLNALRVCGCKYSEDKLTETFHAIF